MYYTYCMYCATYRTLYSTAQVHPFIHPSIDLSNMITSLSWIPKGAARSVPVRYELSAMEIKKLKKMTLSSVNKNEDNYDDNHNDDADEGVDQGRSSDNNNNTDTNGDDDDDLPPELRMNDYDDDEDEEFLNEEQRAGEDDDDHLAIIEEDQVAYADEDEWDEEDLEDNVIKPTDSLILGKYPDMLRVLSYGLAMILSTMLIVSLLIQWP